jgi:hypothetical protein
MRNRLIALVGGIAGGFLLGRSGSSTVARVLVLVALCGAAGWIARGYVDRASAPSPDRHRRRFETYWPARCSHCGLRQGPGTRMLAGRDAYICELCVRRGVEMLDAPDAITRFL